MDFVLHWIFGFVFQIRSYTGNKKDFLLSHVIFAVTMFCFKFVSCLTDIRFVIASPLFHVGNSLHVGPVGVKMYSVTVVSIVIEFGKRNKSVFTFVWLNMDIRFFLVYVTDNMLVHRNAND